MVAHDEDGAGSYRTSAKARARAMDSNVFENGREENSSTGQDEAKAVEGGCDGTVSETREERAEHT